MARRPRKNPLLSERFASALADKLPQEQRDDLRRRRVPADDVIRLFTPDHIVLHAFDGSDLWWNLDMRVRGPELKAKDARDTSIVAKSVRLRGTEEERKRRMVTKGDPGGRRAPKATIRSRGFDKGNRPLRSRNTLQRRKAR